MTVVLPPDTLEIFKEAEVIPLILQQNGLTGGHSNPRFKTKPKGVTLVTMGVAPEMIPLIRALGGKGSCGACPVKINVKKEEDSKKKEEEDSKKADEAGTAKETAAENAEKNVEEETPETAAKQGEPEKMDTTIREDKLDTTVREDKMNTTVQGDKMDTIVQEDMDPANW